MFRNEIRIKSTVCFHLYCKLRCFWRNLHRWQKFYTAAGSDGIDKYHLCPPLFLLIHLTWCCRSFASFLLCSGWHWLSQQPSRNLNVSSTSWFEPCLAKLHFCKCVLLFYSGQLSWCINKQDPFFLQSLLLYPKYFWYEMVDQPIECSLFIRGPVKIVAKIPDFVDSPPSVINFEKSAIDWNNSKDKIFRIPNTISLLPHEL